MKTLLIYTFSLFLVVLAGCSKDKIPGVYRIDIQQGNDVTQEMLNQLKPDMTKSQVSYIMGTPLLIDTFHPDRWDYIYSFHPGNGDREQRRITLYFEDDKLDHIEGDTRTVARSELETEDRTGKNVVVPLTEQETGFFRGLMNSIGLGEEEPEIIKTPEESENPESSTETEAAPQ